MTLQFDRDELVEAIMNMAYNVEPPFSREVRVTREGELVEGPVVNLHGGLMIARADDPSDWYGDEIPEEKLRAWVIETLPELYDHRWFEHPYNSDPAWTEVIDEAVALLEGGDASTV